MSQTATLGKQAAVEPRPTMSDMTGWCQAARKLVLGDGGTLTAEGRKSEDLKQSIKKVAARLGELEERDETQAVYDVHLKTFEEIATRADNLPQTKDKKTRRADLKVIATDLAKLAEDIKMAISALPEPEADAISKDYEKKRARLYDRIAKARHVRGADQDAEMQTLIANALQTIDAADLLMSKGDKENAKLKLDDQKTFSTDVSARKAVLTEAKKDQKSAPKYWEAYVSVQRVREEIASMPGAVNSLRDADQLLATTRAGQDGRPTSGFVATLELLTGQDATLRQRAQEETRDFVATLNKDPLFKAEQQRVDTALQGYAELFPKSRTDTQKRLADQAKGEANPVESLRMLADHLETDITLQETRKDELTRLRSELGKLIPQLMMQAPEHISKGLEESQKRIADLAKGKQIEAALDLANATRRETDQAIQDYQEGPKGWSTAKGAVVDLLNTTAADWKDAPSLASFIQAERGDLTRIDQHVQKTRDFADGKRALDRLTARIEAQKKLVGTNAQAFGQQEALWRAAEQEAKAALTALHERLKTGGINAVGAVTKDLAAQLSACQSRWLALLIPGDEGQDMLVEATAEVKALTDLKNAIATVSPTDFEGLVAAGRKADLEAARKDLLKSVRGHLDDLDVLDATNAAGLRTRADNFASGEATEENVAGLRTIAKLAEDAINQKRDPEAKATLKMLDKLVADLTPIFDRTSYNFKGYYEELLAQCDDIQAMAKSGDASLVVEAKRRAEEVKAALQSATADPNKGPQPANVTFEHVEKLWDELGHKLGDDDLVKTYMRATYFDLKRQYVAAIAIAKKSPPQEGFAALYPLVDPIDQAVTDAKVAKERKVLYDVMLSQIESKIEKLHALTRTRVTEKTTAYNEQMETRLHSAKEMSKQEGQLQHALDMLRKIDAEVTGMLSMDPEKARAELQRLDAEAAQEQRKLRDMVRVWESTLDFWSKKLLPQVKKGMKKQGKEDLTEYKDLKAALKRAGQPLKPYVEILSGKPWESMGANKSPDMNAARAAFGQAHLRLQSLNKVAQRLMTGADTTNVDLEKDWNKLEQEWTARVGRLELALEKLGKSLRELPTQASTDQASENYLADIDALQANVRRVDSALKTLAGRFDPDSFKSPLSVMRDETADPQRKLKAREDALRTVRLLRDNLVKNPLCKKLAGQSVLDVSVTNELGLVRASLKKVELAVLVNI